jgi:hypothetical protein
MDTLPAEILHQILFLVLKENMRCWFEISSVCKTWRYVCDDLDETLRKPRMEMNTTRTEKKRLYTVLVLMAIARKKSPGDFKISLFRRQLSRAFYPLNLIFPLSYQKDIERIEFHWSDPTIEMVRDAHLVDRLKDH